MTTDRPSHLRFAFSESEWCTVKLLWDEAPKTCAAVLSQIGLSGDGKLVVGAMHGRHSGAEALFLTPEVLRDVGEENLIPPFQCKKGDFGFTFEPKGCCEHGDEDRSEVAWAYGRAVQPRRWVSKDNRDPDVNQKEPFVTEDVSLNKFGFIEAEHGFYDASGKLIITGRRDLTVTLA